MNPPQTLQRRQFLQATTGTIVGLGGSKLKCPHQKITPQWAMLIDLQRCMGCQSCVTACKLANHTEKDKFLTWLSIRELEVGSNRRMVFLPFQCCHCQDPPCMAACKSGAIKQLPNGIIITDWSLCQGHGDCLRACPMGVRLQDSRYGNRADSCDFCLERISQGLRPVCVETCPSGARIFGDLVNPTGEFKRYLENKPLASPLSSKRITTRLFYVLP